ncbi:MAG: hypothetical protein OFPI_35150 [Osedax symbiont Rs2]|nr:MAG: hypothetical protein OFPI_35150 [Osedax symbiont Rs2]
MTLYRKFTSEEQINLEYNAVLAVPDLHRYVDQDIEASRFVKSEFDCHLDQAYGAGSDETIDIFPAKDPDSPILFFIHGGYWRSLSSQDFSFVARGLVESGVTVAMPNYSLCPEVSMTKITEQNRAALAWLYLHAEKYNGSRDRIFVSGHSAGGQQAAMLSLTDWASDFDLPGNVIKGSMPISGIFDLSPLYHSWLQPSLKLTDATILSQSPMLQLPKQAPPMLVSVGGDESAEFVRQSTDFVSAWRNNAVPGILNTLDGKNHFSVIQDLYVKDSPLCKSIIEFMQQCES